MYSLFHGSFLSGFTILKPMSKSQHHPTEKVVYLTAHRAYALFYIWDAQHNRRNNKWVTCSLKNGIVEYQEQFPNQLVEFYNGVSGYLYTVLKDNTFIKAPESDMWLSKDDVPIQKTEFIHNVYEEMLRYEQIGKIKILRYTSLSETDKSNLVDRMVGYIMRKNLIAFPECEEAQFVSTYFIEAWEKAISSK